MVGFSFATLTIGPPALIVTGISYIRVTSQSMLVVGIERRNDGRKHNTTATSTDA